MLGAAGLADFTPQDAEELVRYAVRRGLIGPDEGDRVLTEVQDGLRKKKPVAVKKAPTKKKKR
jgi:polyhydroxyalkanoate synthesis regulator phasin